MELATADVTEQLGRMLDGSVPGNLDKTVAELEAARRTIFARAEEVGRRRDGGLARAEALAFEWVGEIARLRSFERSPAWRILT
jgi:hypothetical protein